jgi:hypothetical protein
LPRPVLAPAIMMAGMNDTLPDYQLKSLGCKQPATAVYRFPRGAFASRMKKFRRYANSTPQAQRLSAESI